MSAASPSRGRSGSPTTRPPASRRPKRSSSRRRISHRGPRPTRWQRDSARPGAGATWARPTSRRWTRIGTASAFAAPPAPPSSPSSTRLVLCALRWGGRGGGLRILINYRLLFFFVNFFPFAILTLRSLVASRTANAMSASKLVNSCICLCVCLCLSVSVWLAVCVFLCGCVYVSACVSLARVLSACLSVCL